MRAGLIALSISTLAGWVYGQAQPAPRSQVVGMVKSVNAEANLLMVTSDQGSGVEVTTSAAIPILHMAPGVTDPAKAPRMAVSEIMPGDRLIVYYRGAPDQKSVQATSLVVRTKADLLEIAKAELEDWRKRGTVGLVIAIDAGAKTIALRAGSGSATVTPSDKTLYYRYSLDSARPQDARRSSFDEIKAGDQVHLLGNRSEDGTRISAEVIYAGTFRQLAVTVVSIDAAGSEIKVKDLSTKKALVLKVNGESIMKKLDSQTASTLARQYGSGRGQRGGGTPAGGRAGEDLKQILDRLPAMTLPDLKAGDALMVSTTMGSDPGRVSLVTLLAGVEPLLTAAPNSVTDIMRGWNLNSGSEGN
jgi:hypothetical protein